MMNGIKTIKYNKMNSFFEKRVNYWFILIDFWKKRKRDESFKRPVTAAYFNENRSKFCAVYNSFHNILFWHKLAIFNAIAGDCTEYH